jgi:hypothetical protein
LSNHLIRFDYSFATSTERQNCEEIINSSLWCCPSSPRHQASRKHLRRARAPLVCPSRKGRSARRRADESPQKHRMARPPRPRPIISAITRSEAGRCLHMAESISNARVCKYSDGTPDENEPVAYRGLVGGYRVLYCAMQQPADCAVVKTTWMSKVMIGCPES